MREILFKAKRIDNGEWVEGDLQQDKDLRTAFISGWEYSYSETGIEREQFEHEVIPETICQYTGLTDKNDKKIWENDIVQNKAKWGEWLGKVTFKNYCFVIEWHRYRKHSESGMSAFTEDLINVKEVIGNIFDNADLLS